MEGQTPISHPLLFPSLYPLCKDAQNPIARTLFSFLNTGIRGIEVLYYLTIALPRKVARIISASCCPVSSPCIGIRSRHTAQYSNSAQVPRRPVPSGEGSVLGIDISESLQNGATAELPAHALLCQQSGGSRKFGTCFPIESG